jgi:hypothetical protein
VLAGEKSSGKSLASACDFFSIEKLKILFMMFLSELGMEIFISSYVILWNKQENVFLADKFARTNCVVIAKTRSIMLQQLSHKTVSSSRNS